MYEQINYFTDSIVRGLQSQQLTGYNGQGWYYWNPINGNSVIGPFADAPSAIEALQSFMTNWEFIPPLATKLEGSQ